MTKVYLLVALCTAIWDDKCGLWIERPVVSTDNREMCERFVELYKTEHPKTTARCSDELPALAQGHNISHFGKRQ